MVTTKEDIEAKIERAKRFREGNQKKKKTKGGGYGKGTFFTTQMFFSPAYQTLTSPALRILNAFLLKRDFGRAMCRISRGRRA